MTSPRSTWSLRLTPTPSLPVTVSSQNSFSPLNASAGRVEGLTCQTKEPSAAVSMVLVSTSGSAF